jgi:hypothetical protein
MAKQIIAAALIFSASLLLLYWAAWNVSATTAPQDLRAFWAASKLAHSDPYDKASVTSLEHAIPGYPDCEPLVMRNPPWALPFVLPMAGLEYRTAYAVSLVVNIALVLGCSIAFWHFFGGDGSLLPILLALSFGPAIWLIKMGQSSALAMLGVTLFCFALRREWYYAAGGSLLLIVIKPHLFLPMLLVVFAWALYQRKFALLAGASVAIGAASMAWADPDRVGSWHYCNLVVAEVAGLSAGGTCSSAGARFRCDKLLCVSLRSCSAAHSDHCSASKPISKGRAGDGCYVEWDRLDTRNIWKADRVADDLSVVDGIGLAGGLLTALRCHPSDEGGNCVSGGRGYVG